MYTKLPIGYNHDLLTAVNNSVYVHNGLTAKNEPKPEPPRSAFPYKLIHSLDELALFVQQD